MLVWEAANNATIFYGDYQRYQEGDIHNHKFHHQSTLMKIQESLGLTSQDTKAALITLVKNLSQSDIKDNYDEMIVLVQNIIVYKLKQVRNARTNLLTFSPYF